MEEREPRLFWWFCINNFPEVTMEIRLFVTWLRPPGVIFAASGGWRYGRDLCRATYEGIHVHPFDIDSCTLTLTADRPRHTANCTTALPKVSSRVYVCTNASELITTQQESSGLHKSWSTQSLMHVHIGSYWRSWDSSSWDDSLCFITKVWLVTLIGLTSSLSTFEMIKKHACIPGQGSK